MAYSSLVADYSFTNREDHSSKRKVLVETYDLIEEEVLTQKISEVEEAHVNQKHAMSWKLINEITGRKSSKPSQIKGDTIEQRVEAWYNHFKNLLGDEPEVLDAQAEVEQVFKDLDIEDGPFNHEEYVKAKVVLKGGKCSGEDGVVPEVLNHVPIDDLVLDFINNAGMAKALNISWQDHMRNVDLCAGMPKALNISWQDHIRNVDLYAGMAKALNISWQDHMRNVDLYAGMAKALNISWQDHMRNVDLYAGMPKALNIWVTEKIHERRLERAGHCVRHLELATSPTILWEPTWGTASSGRRCLSFVDMLKRDTGLASAEELRSCMLDRDIWIKITRQAQAAVWPRLD